MADGERGTGNGRPNGGRGPWRAFALVSGIGMQLAAAVLAGVYIGRWLDRLWGTSPWMLLAGVLLGLAAGILGVVRLVKTVMEGPSRDGR
ncbi:MAG: AtpZ/AtpI family protein [Alicyclobacillaceae bacterium]|nr:AtpZ/AtpI family protein [Alicyclobacillaceae bacterium]